MGDVIRVCDADNLKDGMLLLLSVYFLNEPQLSVAVCTSAQIISFSLSQDAFSVQRAVCSIPAFS